MQSQMQVAQGQGLFRIVPLCKLQLVSAANASNRTLRGLYLLYHLLLWLLKCLLLAIIEPLTHHRDSELHGEVLLSIFRQFHGVIAPET